MGRGSCDPKDFLIQIETMSSRGKEGEPGGGKRKGTNLRISYQDRSGGDILKN